MARAVLEQMIGPNATLLFDVELISITPADID
jgi:FKBP-type peptidyl-prolyl cis-trans isomerase